MTKVFEFTDLIAEYSWSIGKKLGGDGVLVHPVISQGTTGEEWIKIHQKKGYVSDQTKSILRSPNFNPTTGVKTYVVIFKVPAHRKHVPNKIRTEAIKRGWKIPDTEVSQLFRARYRDGRTMDELDDDYWYRKLGFVIDVSQAASFH